MTVLEPAPRPLLALLIRDRKASRIAEDLTAASLYTADEPFAPRVDVEGFLRALGAEIEASGRGL